MIEDLPAKRDLIRRLRRTANALMSGLTPDDRAAVEADMHTLTRIDEDLLRLHGSWHRAAEIEDEALNRMVTDSKARRVRAGVN